MGEIEALGEAARAHDRASHPNAVHMLRTMQGHHIALSSMADQKANILIGVNSVIFALVVRTDEVMTLPMLVLAASAGMAAILCMLAVVPAIGSGKRQGPALPPNLLFFGSFTAMREDDFIAALDIVDADDLLIRRAMARDAYQLGLVLKHKKYKYLGWAYRVFMGGLLLSFAAFVGQALLR